MKPFDPDEAVEFVKVDHYLVTVFDMNGKQWWIHQGANNYRTLTTNKKDRHRFSSASDARQAISDVISKLPALGLSGSIYHDKWKVIAVREVETVI